MLNDDIKAKNDQIATLEKQILDFVMTSHEALDKSDIVQVGSHCQILCSGLVLSACHLFLKWFLYYLQAVAELRDQLNEKSFELEVT